MNSNSIDGFVRDVMAIRTSSFSFLGIRSIGDQAVYQLRKSVMNYVAEYQDGHPNKDRLKELKSAVEGNLEVLATVAVISTEKFEHLTDSLQNLR